jgi:polyhydroxybutyrate depolymerase
MMHSIRLIVCFVLAPTLSCLFAPPSLGAESAARKLVVGGVERSYLLSRPAQGGPQPTVVVLHGGTLDATNARRTTGFEALVERHGIVAVYPDAIGRNWNDGRSKGPGRSDDVAFFRALVEALVAEGIADPRRVYVTGPSNGGMMTLRLVCEAADLIAAAAAIIASLPAELAAGCKPSRPVPVLLMNGTADPLVPYAGGSVGYFGRRGDVLSTDATLTKLRVLNDCPGEATTTRLPDLDPNDGSNVTVYTWSCASGASVVLYRVEGGGHRIPQRSGGARPVIDRLLGRENHDLDAAEAIWTFFQDKRR